MSAAENFLLTLHWNKDRRGIYSQCYELKQNIFGLNGKTVYQNAL